MVITVVSVLAQSKPEEEHKKAKEKVETVPQEKVPQVLQKVPAKAEQREEQEARPRHRGEDEEYAGGKSESHPTVEACPMHILQLGLEPK